MSDQDQRVALVDGINKNLGQKPKEASADAAYCSGQPQRPGRSRDRRLHRNWSCQHPAGRMKAQRLAYPGHGGHSGTRGVAKPLEARKASGRVGVQIKQARGFKQFLLRGIDKVKPIPEPDFLRCFESQTHCPAPFSSLSALCRLSGSAGVDPFETFPQAQSS